MEQPAQGDANRHDRPAIVIVFAGLLLILAALCVFAVARGSLRWPAPILAAVIFVITARGVWQLRYWARQVAIILLGLALFIVPFSVAGYWEATIVPIADLLAIICACPPLLPLGLLLYWFLSNEEYFQ